MYAYRVHASLQEDAASSHIVPDMVLLSDERPEQGRGLRQNHEVRPSHKKGPAFWHQEGPASREVPDAA